MSDCQRCGGKAAGEALVADTVSIIMCDQCPTPHPKAFCPATYRELEYDGDDFCNHLADTIIRELQLQLNPDGRK